jgi:hypothetical protein
VAETAKVTEEGVLVRRPLIEGWGDVKEVEIEQRPDAIIITPRDLWPPSCATGSLKR